MQKRFSARRLIYHAANALGAAAVLLYGVPLVMSAFSLARAGAGPNLIWLLPACALLLTSYALRSLRMYLIFMESRIMLARFLRIQLKCLLVSLTMPFKLGEIFRAYWFGQAIGSPSGGIASVLVDRYFDSVALVLGMLGLWAGGGVQPQLIFVLLTLFVLAATAFYWAFPSTYRYFNRFLVLSIRHPVSVKMLSGLEKLNHWYQNLSAQVKGRAPALIWLSLMVWAFEGGALLCVAMFLGEKFQFSDLFSYLSGVLGSSSRDMSTLHMGLGVFLLAAYGLVLYGGRWKQRRRAS